MVLVLDNYDSFTFNLVQYLGELGAELHVRRNDAVSVDDVELMRPTRIVISPGPGHPVHAGISVELVRRVAGRIPILGVCLGHQAIGHAFGGRVAPAPAPKHGKTSMVTHDGRGLFQGLTSPLEVGRYHSLAIADEGWPDGLVVAARSDDVFTATYALTPMGEHAAEFGEYDIAIGGAPPPPVRRATGPVVKDAFGNPILGTPDDAGVHAAATKAAKAAGPRKKRGRPPKNKPQ